MNKYNYFSINYTHSKVDILIGDKNIQTSVEHLYPKCIRDIIFL